VVHAARGTGTESRVGFVVSKAVGGAVVRNRVKRRLRHLVAQELATSTSAQDVVVRALPGAATTPARLEGDLTSAWTQALHRLTPGPARTSP
jgi:ribonuclease P protein component